MKILVLNGSPHPKGSTKQMVTAFAEGAVSVGHEVTAIDVSIAIQKVEAVVYNRMTCRKSTCR